MMWKVEMCGKRQLAPKLSFAFPPISSKWYLPKFRTSYRSHVQGSSNTNCLGLLDPWIWDRDFGNYNLHCLRSQKSEDVKKVLIISITNFSSFFSVNCCSNNKTHSNEGPELYINTPKQPNTFCVLVLVLQF